MRCLRTDSQTRHCSRLGARGVRGGGSGGRKASCSRRGRGDRRCCCWGGRGGPGMIVTRLGWPALEAAVGEKKRETMSGVAKQPVKIFIFPLPDDFQSCSSVHIKTASAAQKQSESQTQT